MPRSYPEVELFVYRPKNSPPRDSSQDPKTKDQLTSEIFHKALAHFKRCFKQRYAIDPVIKVPRLRLRFTDLLNHTMTQCFREHQCDWGALPPFACYEGPAKDLFEERLRVALSYVDWLFTPGNRFKDICPGDFTSAHWWNQYTVHCKKQAAKTKSWATVEDDAPERARYEAWEEDV